MIAVELVGLEVFGYHGVEEDERREGQPFLYDVWLDVSDAARSDRLEDAVDYRDVAACVRDVSGGRQFQLLEALAGSVAEALVERFPVERARVRVRKPRVQPAGLTVEHAAATVEASRLAGGRSNDQLVGSGAHAFAGADAGVDDPGAGGAAAH